VKLDKLLEKDYHIPVILGGGPNGLGLVRSLGAEGINSVITDVKKNFSFSSKYVAGLVCPHPSSDEEGFLKFLTDLGKRMKKKGVLYVTNDHWMIPLSKNQSLLSEYYLFTMSEWNVIESCTDKKKMYAIAEKSDIAYPKTYYLNDIAEIDNIYHEIPYPCILKPVITLDFADKLKSKARVFNLHNREELESLVEKIKSADLRNREIVIQEYIPGGIETLYTITTYSNMNADIVAYSTGHKLRQRPPDAGTIISGKVIPEPRLFEPASRLIKNAGFFGIANTEFKYDKRDDTYKLIEINPRPGKWNYSVMATGINMPFMIWNELQGKKTKPLITSPKELIWLCFIEDFYNSVLGGFKRKGYPEFQLSIGKYCKSIRGKKVDAIFNLKDIKPGLSYLRHP
jgi:predicted ATP-grasp superfamily ATP-dependent carboligase